MKGTNTYRFIALPSADGKGWQPFVLGSELEGAIINSRASYLEDRTWAYRSERESFTEVEVDLPVGTLMKRVVKRVGRGFGSTTNIFRLSEEEEDWEFVAEGKTKKTATGWVTVADIDGIRYEF